MFRSKKLALALATCGVATTAVAGTAGAGLVDESHTVKVPGYVPAFFVGPIDDGDPATEDMKAGSDNGMRNIQITVKAAADVRPTVSTVAGAAPGCAATATLNQSLSIRTARAATVRVISRWDEVRADGSVVRRVQELVSRTEAGSLVRSIPICVS